MKAQSIRIFIADDHALMRVGLRSMLGLEPDLEIVGEAADGEDVAIALRKHLLKIQSPPPPEVNDATLCYTVQQGGIMERLTIQVGGFEVNCSILSENGKAWIVDPGQEPGRIIDLLAKKGLEPAAILLTHGHFDHIGGIPGLLEKFPDLPVYVHEKDMQMFGHPLNQLPPEYPPVEGLRGSRSLRGLRGIEGLEVEIIETPGHTPGGVCYYFPNFQTSQTSKPLHLLLSGDTLFAGSVGRTDLPGGDMATLMDSLQKLTALPDDTLVIPGHGMHTRIALEKSGNPFLQ